VSEPTEIAAVKPLGDGEVVALHLDARTDGPTLLAAGSSFVERVSEDLTCTPSADTRFLTHLALRTALARLVPEAASQSLLRDARGKPFVEGAQALDISLAHSGNFGLLVISRGGPVGVDVEPCDRAIAFPDTRLAQLLQAAANFPGRRTLHLDGVNSTAERDALAAWTLLEAAGKCDGRGVFALMGDTGVLARSGLDGASDWPEVARGWSAETWCLEACAIGTVVCPKTARLISMKPFRSIL
jgi:phosphopantetheinyl transferase